MSGHVFLRRRSSSTFYSCGTILNEHFSGKRNGHVELVNWPPISPDLAPLDYCLRGWMKNEISKLNLFLNNLKELVIRILNAAALIKEHEVVLKRATQDIRKC